MVAPVSWIRVAGILCSTSSFCESIRFCWRAAKDINGSRERDRRWCNDTDDDDGDGDRLWWSFRRIRRRFVLRWWFSNIDSGSRSIIEPVFDDGVSTMSGGFSKLLPPDESGVLCTGDVPELGEPSEPSRGNVNVSSSSWLWDGSDSLVPVGSGWSAPSWLGDSTFSSFSSEN